MVVWTGHRPLVDAFEQGLAIFTAKASANSDLWQEMLDVLQQGALGFLPLPCTFESFLECCVEHRLCADA